MYINESPVSIEACAKPVIDGKFWIVEHNGERIATLRKMANGNLKLSGANNTCETFQSVAEIEQIFGNSFFKKPTVSVKHTQEYAIDGYPCSAEPVNGQQDLQINVPTFYKSATSHVKFCAGYYAVKFPNGWVPSFCPKFATLEVNEFKGPFRTEIEMKLALSNAKSN